MQSKHTHREVGHETPTTSFSQLLDDELRVKLATVGPRARKHVSEGHLTKCSPSLSYAGLTTGTLDQEEIKADYYKQMAARPAFSTGNIGVKRLRDEDEEDGGDTDDDEAEEKPFVNYEKKIFYRPHSFNSTSSQTNDFEDADFLRPQR